MTIFRILEQGDELYSTLEKKESKREREKKGKMMVGVGFLSSVRSFRCAARTCCAFVAHRETQRGILFGGEQAKHRAFACKHNPRRHSRVSNFCVSITLDKLVSRIVSCEFFESRIFDRNFVSFSWLVRVSLLKHRARTQISLIEREIFYLRVLLW